MNLMSHLHRLSATQQCATAMALLGGSMLLLWMHAGAVRDMREVGLPAAIALPQIEQRLSVLSEQKEVGQLQAAMRGGSEEEMLHVYVIPEDDDIDRLLATFDVLFNYLEQKRLLTDFSEVSIGERTEAGENLFALPFTFEADLTQEGLSQLLLFIDLSGLLTVGDVLSQEEIDRLLAATEQEHPTAIAALEHFLSTDLVRYAQESRPYEEQLKKSFVSPISEPVLQSVFQSARLRKARALFADLAPVLHQQNLWPLRFLSVERAEYRTKGDSAVHAAFTVKAYVRGE